MIGNWEFGVRPEIVEVRYVKIQEKRFPLDLILDVLSELEYTDILNPLAIHDADLAEVLQIEGMVYKNGEGFVGTEKIGEALERLRSLRKSDLAKHVNPTLKTGYICSTTFDHELEKTPVTIYQSPEAQRKEEGCVDAEDRTCILIKVHIHAVEVVE